MRSQSRDIESERASAHIPGLGVYADPIPGFRRLGFGRQERERGGDIKRWGRDHKSEGQKRHFGCFFFYFFLWILAVSEILFEENESVENGGFSPFSPL